MISALLVSSLLGAGSPSGPEVGAALSTLRRGFLEDGDDRVSIIGTHRIVSHSDGSLELQGELPLRITLQSVRRDRGPSCATTQRTREIDAVSPRTVRSQHSCSSSLIEETWTNEPAGLEHAFMLQRAPEGSGGLTLRLSVHGPWHHADGDGQVFKGPGAATGWRYGNAFVVRGERRLPISVTHVEGGLELRVPQALLEAPGAFPMLIDPILAMELPLDPSANGFQSLPSQEETPAIAVNSAGMGMVVWADNRRQFASDIFGARFNSSGGLQDNVGLALVVDVGHQSRPALCADGTSFLLAWELALPDGGVSIRACTVLSNGSAMPATTLTQGSQPSLATAGDAGYAVLAYVDPTNTAVQVMQIIGTVPSQPWARPAVAAFDGPSRPMIAASNRSWFVAWESNRTLTQGAIKGMASGASSPVLLDVSPNTASLGARRPTVALGTEVSGDNVVVYWEQGLNSIAGARVTNGPPPVVTPITAFAGSSPALVRTSTALNAQPTLGYFAGGGLVVKDLADGGVTTLAAGPGTNDLVLAFGGKVYAAWTEGPFGGSDVMGVALAFTGMNLQRIPVSQAAIAQRAPRVAMKDDFSEGLAVWLEGANVIRGSRVSAQNGGVTFGSAFLLADQNQGIDQLDLAAAGNSGRYLITWRQSGTILVGQMADSSAMVGNLIPLSATATGGPAVAWDEQRTRFVVAFSQGLPSEVFSRTVQLNGIPSASSLPYGGGQAVDIDLTCLSGECLLAWSRRDMTVVAVVIDSMTPLFTRPMASLPTVSHDGRNFFLGWRSNTGLAFAEVDFVTGRPVDLQGGVNTGVNSIGAFSLAPGVPPVVAWSEAAPNEETSVYLQRIDFAAARIPVAAGMLPIVATSAPQPGAQGVIVYQRYQSSDAFRVMRSFGAGFAFPWDAGVADAGVVDAGVIDAGTPDAGVVDGGLPQSDGGVDAGEAPDAGVMTFQTSGCSCDAGSGAPLLLFALLALRRRNR